MHWLTILTTLAYSAILAFLVLVQEWELWRAAIAVSGFALIMIIAIIAIIAGMQKTETEPFWQWLKISIRTELRGLLNLIRFK